MADFYGEVILEEEDRTLQPPSTRGSSAIILIPAKKGPVLDPTPVSDPVDYLETYTPAGRIEVGDDLSHYSALECLRGSDALIPIRVADTPYYAGCILGVLNSHHKSFDAGQNLPALITGVDTSQSQRATLTGGSRQPILLESVPTSAIAASSISGGGVTTWDAAASRDANAVSADGDWFYDSTSRTLHVFSTTGGTLEITYSRSTLSFGANELLAVVAKNQGEWGDDLAVSVHATSRLGKIGDAPSSGADNRPNAGVELRVYYDGTQVESHLISRISGRKDGFGRSTYAPEVVERDSKYIDILVNGAPNDGSNNIANTVEAGASAVSGGNTPVRTEFGGGGDGAILGDEDYTSALNLVDDNELFPAKFLMDGGKTTQAVQGALLDSAESRWGYALLSVPAGAKTVESFRTHRNTTLNADTSFGVLFGPWVKIQDPFNGRQLYIPPDGPVAGRMGLQDRSIGLQHPVAGNRNGRLSPRILDVEARFTKTQIASIQRIGGINVIRYRPGRGIALWGNHTLQVADSALNSQHVRLVFNEIALSLQTIGENFVFILNDEATRSDLYGVVSSMLARRRRLRQFKSFRVKCDSENNPPEEERARILHCWQYITPLYATEEVRFRTIVSLEEDTEVNIDA